MIDDVRHWERSVRKLLFYFLVSAVAVGAFALSVWEAISPQPMDPSGDIALAPRETASVAPLAIRYPPDEAVFPPEIAPPTFSWEDSRSGADRWLVTLSFEDGGEPLTAETHAEQWTPAGEQWQSIKQRSVMKPAEFTVYGFSRADPQQVLSTGRISISTSEDEVGAPLFFREVNLPFLTAVKNPAAHIRWRFGPISSPEPPPIVLEKLPVCGNCHSFSADGSTLAMEVDSGNDKGSYAIASVQEHIRLDPDKIMTWSDYRREDGDQTFGLLCQASPDGRYVVGTVKDRALAVYRPDLAFSQLFFLVKGILAIHDRQTGSITALPGADDPEHVQTNATWSPDGKSIVFARSHGKAYDPPSLRGIDSVLVPAEEGKVFVEGGRKFLFDLYRIPFNGGKGGKAEPIQGASDNGMSNYFARFSPDGKWIVFCKAKSFMLLQPDSELYIIPAAGGEARRLRCNTDRMNSWHSWSPNGKWLVFSSKAYSIYTQLLLTHIDEQGRSTPAVVLANFTEENRAANIPEFANIDPEAIKQISVHFLDDTNYLRAGDEFRKQADFAGSIPLYHKALEINPENAEVHANLGISLMQQGKHGEAVTHLTRAVELEPDLARAHCNLGVALRGQGRLREAAAGFREALQADPELVSAHLHLGTLLLDTGEIEEGRGHLAEAVRLDADNLYGHFNLAMAWTREGRFDEAAVHLGRALEEEPEFVPAMVCLALIRASSPEDGLRNGEEAVELAAKACSLTRRENPEALHALAAAYAEIGRFPDAVSTAEEAIRITRTAGNHALAEAIRQPLEMYRRQQPYRSASPGAAAGDGRPVEEG